MTESTVSTNSNAIEALGAKRKELTRQAELEAMKEGGDVGAILDQVAKIDREIEYRKTVGKREERLAQFAADKQIVADMRAQGEGLKALAPGFLKEAESIIKRAIKCRAELDDLADRIEAVGTFEEGAPNYLRRVFKDLNKWSGKSAEEVLKIALEIVGNLGNSTVRAAELEGLTFAAIDEVTGAFDVSEVKRLTGGSVVSIEKKGRDGYEIPQRWALAALTNKLPSFQPATDSAFLQRLIIVPFDSVFYFDDIQREEYLRLGIDESKLKPARNKEELLAQIQGERPAIIRFLIETYQAMRKAGGRPYECGRSLQIKQTYQGQNDLVAAFFLEYLERDPAGRVEYSRILDLWKTYTGEKAASIREITKRLIERFPWIEKRISHSTRFLAGIKELDGGDEKQRQPEGEAKGKALALDEKSIESGYGGTENDTFHLRAGKNEKSHSKMETPLFRTPVPEIYAKSAPTAAETSPETSRVYDEFLRLLELHERNLSAAGQDPGRALVELIELRLQCGKAGILGDSFSKAFEELRGQGLVEYQDPHIFAPMRQAARV